MTVRRTASVAQYGAARFSTAVFLLLVVPLMVPLTAGAQVPGLEKLVMPGRVIQGHADIEGDCAACHDTQSDLPQAALCIVCHEDVGEDRIERTGFHGVFDAAQRNECVVCHTDHEGQDADIVPVDSGLFDHNFSDFPLLGAHLSAACGDCHVAGEKYRAASFTCSSCHANDDVHDGTLGSACEDCHNENAWADSGFDHNTVGYPLTGGHTKVECIDCHRGNVFDGTPTQCIDCHAVDDVHAGSNGVACHDCHSTATWRTIGFDHSEETGFALEDGHGGLNCQDCHTREDFKDGLTGACSSCHADEDNHQGRNGTECGTCHRATRWSDSIFDHSETDFALHDSHAELHCSACHKVSAEPALPLSCGGCHVLDDSHDGQMGEDCGTCHEQTEWHASIAFDHDLSEFPLTGMHAVAACGRCHDSNRFNDADTECVNCHTGDDVHQGALGSACDDCHTSNEWPVAVFDHDTQTNFALDGAHTDLACGGCHRGLSADVADVPSTCGGCHQADDVHAGQFGLRCDECHNRTTFSDVDHL